MASLVSLQPQSDQTPSGAGKRGASQLSAATGCERAYALRFHHRITVDREPEYRLLGTLIHTGLAFHYQSRIDPPPTTQPRWFQGGLEAALRHDARGRADLVKQAQSVLRCYEELYREDHWTPISVEHNYEATLGEIDPTGEERYPGENEERISGKTDLVVRANGRVWIVDHKTQSHGWNSDRLSAWEDDGPFQLSWQVLLYLHVVRAACRRDGLEPPHGFIIQRLTRKLPFDSDRTVLRIPTEAYQLAPKVARHFIRQEKTLKAKILRNEPLVPFYSMCYGRYGACDYAPLCAAGPQEREALMGVMYRPLED